MNLRASLRRDQRRRLLTSRTSAGAGSPAAGSSAAEATAVAGYDDDAHPERHPALATRLPVGVGPFVLAVAGIVAVFAGSITLAVSGPLLDRPLLPAGGRFGRTLAVLAAAFDPRAAMPVHVWLAVLALLLAAAVAGAVRLMRRHRRDDYNGRFRAWGWLAMLLTMAAWAGAVPVGPLFAAVVSDATGIVPGPGGIGWWTGLVTVCLAIVVPWAVLPLRERGATATWMVLALAGWAAAAAEPWAADWVGGGARGAVVARAAWAAGAGAMLIAMLAAARSVIREVRGQCATPVRRSAGRRAAEAASTDPAAGGGDAWREAADDDSPQESDDADAGQGEDEFVDGSERGQRRLSKAERKRLRKLARMQGTAA